MGEKSRTMVYVDGLNLYYGALYRSPFKWLDIRSLCVNILLKDEVLGVKYFTADVIDRPDNPGQLKRQREYIKALEAGSGVEVFRGHMNIEKPILPLADTDRLYPEYVQVERIQEKRTDVALAAHMISDGYRNLYDSAVIISNDSDLIEAINIVRRLLKKKVGILSPAKTPNTDIIESATFYKQIRESALQRAQLPVEIIANGVIIRKPVEWNGSVGGRAYKRVIKVPKKRVRIVFYALIFVVGCILGAIFFSGILPFQSH